MASPHSSRADGAWLRPIDVDRVLQISYADAFQRFVGIDPHSASVKKLAQAATVYDITPSVLVLLGLPPADDMPGQVLWSAFDESLTRDQFTATIPTYGSQVPVEDTGQGTVVDEEIKERLRSLGYID